MKKIIVLVSSLALAAASHAELLKFKAVLTGGQEVPGVTTQGTGLGEVTIDTVALTYTGFVKWKDLNGIPSDSHIHVGKVGVAGSVIYGYGVAGTTIDGAYTRKDFSGNLIDKNPANMGGVSTVGNQTPAQQIASWFSPGFTYLNVHTTAASGGTPSGEIRGQLQAVPEPGTMAALALGAAALLRRRRR